MRLPLFMNLQDRESSETATNGESSSSNARVPILSDRAGLSAEELLNYLPNRNPFRRRPAPGAAVRRSRSETAGIESFLMDVSDLGDDNDSNYVDTDLDFEDGERIATDYGFRIKIDIYGNYTLIRDLPYWINEEDYRQILLAGLHKIRQDNSIEVREPSHRRHPELGYDFYATGTVPPLPREPDRRRHPELAFDNTGFYPLGEVPPLPTIRAETHAGGGESRLSSTMASNIQGLTNNLAESIGEYAAMLEQTLDQTRGELDGKTRELAEVRDRLEAREEQFRSMRAIFDGVLYDP